MGKEFLKIGHIEIEKRKFYSSKSAIAIGDVNTDNITISDEYRYPKSILSAINLMKKFYRYVSYSQK